MPLLTRLVSAEVEGMTSSIGLNPAWFVNVIPSPRICTVSHPILLP